MITDEMIKTEFIHQTVSAGMKKIYATQTETVNTYLTGGTGKLASFLSSAPFQLVDNNSFKKTYHMRLLNYLRFLDIKYSKDQMKLRRKLALYNRVVWGVIFGEVQPNLLYGFTREVRSILLKELKEAVKEHD